MNRQRWVRLSILTVLAVYLYVIMEWLFFVTKPSFMSAMPFRERLATLLLAPLMPLLATSAAILVLAAVGRLLSSSALSDIPLGMARLIPAAVLASLLLILIDNFTYIVLGFGIISSEGVGRAAYAVVLILLLIFIYRQIAQLEKQPWSGRLRNVPGILALGLACASILITSFRSSEQRGLASDLQADPPSLRSRPNILLLGGDGLNASHMSVYGYALDTTPFLRQLAESALVGENNFPNAASSGGSIASVLTGKLPTQTRVIYPPDILTGSDAYEHLPGILRSHGYYAAEISVPLYADASALNMQNAFDRVNSRSFGRNRWLELAPGVLDLNTGYFLSSLSERISGRLLHILYLRRMANPFAEVTRPDPYGAQGDRGRIDELLSLIDSAGSPLFVHIHLMGTHGPIFFPRSPSFSAGSIQDRHWMPEFYDDAILDFDSYVREIFDQLARKGLLDNTIVVVYTDHGKLYTTTESTPLIIWFPEGQHAQRLRSNTQNLDIAPTILDYLGLPTPEWLSGRSLLAGDPDPGRPILSGAFDRESLTKAEGGNWLVDPNRIEPPFYQLGYLRLVLCHRWFELGLRNPRLVYGEIEGHTSPCEVGGLPSTDDVERLLVTHLAENGYDVSGLPRPLPLARGEDRPIPQPEDTWTIVTNVPQERWTAGITQLLLSRLVQVRFPIEDPFNGDFISLSRALSLQPGRMYEISLEVWDPYEPAKFPGVFEQRLYLDGELAWRHDISGDSFSGWQPIRVQHLAQKEELLLTIELLATGQPESGLGWGGAAAIAVRNVGFDVLEDGSP